MPLGLPCRRCEPTARPVPQAPVTALQDLPYRGPPVTVLRAPRYRAAAAPSPALCRGPFPYRNTAPPVTVLRAPRCRTAAPPPCAAGLLALWAHAYWAPGPRPPPVPRAFLTILRVAPPLPLPRISHSCAAGPLLPFRTAGPPYFSRRGPGVARYAQRPHLAP